MEYKILNPYLKTIYDLVQKYGGFFNAHSHLDRANTLDKKYLEHVGMDPLEASSYPLFVKQNLTGDLHTGLAYTVEDLTQRLGDLLQSFVCTGTKRVDSAIDTTSDIGLRAFNITLDLKKKYEEKIDFRIGSYSIFGFKENELERWDVFKKASELSDFIVGLPERDAKPGHVGYDEHMRRLILLGKELDKEVHIHVDQGNDPEENGTETLIQAVRWLNPVGGQVWAVHVISPSCYDEERFNELVDGLVRYDIGVIVCPSAAISMKQYRDKSTPIHNSIARILEFIEAGVKVRIGTDNINDVYIPSGSPNLLDELYVLTNVTRFYNPNVWAKVAAGIPLNKMDREAVRKNLHP